MSKWTELIKECATTKLGINALLPVQQLVIHNIMEALYPEEDKDCYNQQLIILPTGTGKSACFQIPAYLIEGITVIVYPLLSLINDQHRRMNSMGISSYKLIGGISQEEQQLLVNALKNKSCKCILTNPESLANPKHNQLIAEYNPSLVVIDEAHCISKWGKTFRPSYLDIKSSLHILQAPVIVGFTATASQEVIADIKSLLFTEYNSYIFQGHANRENITYSVKHCIDKNKELIEMLGAHINTYEKITSYIPSKSVVGTYSVYNGDSVVQRPVIIFCASRSSCVQLALLLRDNLNGTQIFFYHAGLSKEEKNIIEEWFLNSDNGILVATCAYGMGIDKSNIRTVIHYDRITDIENFLQETGRAGRDKRAAQSIVLADISQIHQDNDFSCRREHYMNSLSLECEGCSGCDKCMNYYPLVSHEFLLILSYLYMFPRCFDKTQLQEKIVEDLSRKGISIQYSHIYNLVYAIQTMLDCGYIIEGKYLWKNKISPLLCINKLFLTREKQQ